MVRPRVALATCAEIPQGDEDFPALVAELAALGVEAVPAVWDAAVDWESFDLVVLRSTWDYAERREEFLRWAGSAPGAQPRCGAGVEHGQGAVPDRPRRRRRADRPDPVRGAGRALDPPGERFVVKPAISAGGRSSAWFSPTEADAARALVGPIHGEGRTAMVQPYLDEAVETALVYVDGEYSHALRRVVPLPAAGEREVFYLDEQVGPGDGHRTFERGGRGGGSLHAG